MKKIIFARVLIVMMNVGANAQIDDFFEWNNAIDYSERTFDPNDIFLFPQFHGSPDDEEAPLGSGLLILAALGAAYAARKRE